MSDAEEEVQSGPSMCEEKCHLGRVPLRADEQAESNGSASENLVFLMGSGLRLDDPEAAAEMLLEREYPEVAGKTLEGAVFGPDFFVPRRPEYLEPPTNKQEREKFKEAELDRLAAEEFERRFFHILKEHFVDKEVRCVACNMNIIILLQYFMFLKDLL
jgi:hypothetical protein